VQVSFATDFEENTMVTPDKNQPQGNDPTEEKTTSSSLSRPEILEVRAALFNSETREETLKNIAHLLEKRVRGLGVDPAIAENLHPSTLERVREVVLGGAILPHSLLPGSTDKNICCIRYEPLPFGSNAEFIREALPVNAAVLATDDGLLGALNLPIDDSTSAHYAMIAIEGLKAGKIDRFFEMQKDLKKLSKEMELPNELLKEYREALAYLAKRSVSPDDIMVAANVADERRGIILGISKSAEKEYRYLRNTEDACQESRALIVPEGLPIKFITAVIPLGSVENKWLDDLAVLHREHTR